MKNYDKITPSEAITLADTLIDAIVKGFENIGFRKNIRARVDKLEELVLLQQKQIKELQEMIH